MIKHLWTSAVCDFMIQRGLSAHLSSSAIARCDKCALKSRRTIKSVLIRFSLRLDSNVIRGRESQYEKDKNVLTLIF